MNDRLRVPWRMLWTMPLVAALLTSCSGGCGGDTTVYQESRCDGRQQHDEAFVDAPFDKDGDGYVDGLNPDCKTAYPPEALDCDDAAPAVNPGAAELPCDGLDNDCAATTADAPDGDGDGVSICTGDCDDTRAEVGPGVPEQCDGEDQDCDASVDEGLDQDDDLDGHTAQGSCGGTRADCDDTQATVNPDAPERCDGVDNNCDGQIDEDQGEEISCDGEDNNCDGQIDEDQGEEVNCDGEDNNCDGQIDEVQGEEVNCDGEDNDCDGQIDEDQGEEISCDGEDNDCDGEIDEDPGPELSCDGEDNDCDGAIDEGAGRTGYLDADQDGYGDDSGPITVCDEAPLVDRGGDCDDGCELTHPGRWELPDGRDNNCDGRPECADLSCDGRPDVVIAERFRSDALVYFASDQTEGDAPFRDPPLVLDCLGADLETGDRGLDDVKLADLDGDGELDVLLASSALGQVCLFFGPLRPTTASPVQPDRLISGSNPYSLDVADVDGDLRPDLLLGTTASDQGQVWLRYWDDALTFSHSESFPIPWGERVALRDVDLDGLPEALVAVVGGSGRDVGARVSSWVLWNSGGTYSMDSATSLSTTAATDVDATDLDGDGLIDVIFSATYYNGDHPSLIYWGSGPRELAASPTNLSGPGASRLSVVPGGTAEGGACSDLLLPGYKGSEGYAQLTGLYRGEDTRGDCGRSVWTKGPEPIEVPATGSTDGLVEDLTGDGISDLLLTQSTNGPSYSLPALLYPGDGAGGFLAAPINVPAYSGFSLATRSSWRAEGCHP